MMLDGSFLPCPAAKKKTVYIKTMFLFENKNNHTLTEIGTYSNYIYICKKKNRSSINATKQWKTTPSKSIAHIPIPKHGTVAAYGISLLLLGYFCGREGMSVSKDLILILKTK